MTLEEVDDLRKSLPDIPPETCPLIDSVIENINSALRLCKRPGSFRYRSDPETLEELASAVESELDGLVPILETIRKHNSTLRELGQEWYQAAKSEASA